MEIQKIISWVFRSLMPRNLERGAVVTNGCVATNGNETRSMHIKKMFKERKVHWVIVILLSLALIISLSGSIMLNRYYFSGGGNSKWLSTLMQLIGWPVLAIPLLLYYYKTTNKIKMKTKLSRDAILSYVGLGVMLLGLDLLYSWGVSYMPASTYSLLCASQLAFNTLFSFFINKQRLSFNIMNSVVLLTIGAILLGLNSDGDMPQGVTHSQYVIGFICTLGASLMFGLFMPLLQLVFDKVVKETSFCVAIEAQIFTSMVATLVGLVGFFASGEHKGIMKELHGFHDGEVAYVMSILWSCVGWQISSMGCVGLVFMVSSLFSNVMGTLALPVVPILSVGVFHDKVSSSKVICLVLSIWGFSSYVYDGYVHSKKMKKCGGSKKSQRVDNSQCAMV